MNPSLSPLIVGAACAAVGVGASVYWLLAYPAVPLVRILSTYENKLDRHASFLMLGVRGSRIARAQLVLVAGSLGLWVLSRHAVFGALAAAIVWAPSWFLRRQHKARVAKLEGQLDTWLLMLANGLKATSSVGEAIASTVVLAPKPFRDEVSLMVKEIQLGAPLDRGLHSMASRIRSPLVSGALGMIAVARQTGGDLPRALERSAAALRESSRLDGVLRAKTAEGRGQVFVLAAVPFVLGVIISWLDPSWFDPMLQQTPGRVLLMGCSLAWAVAVAWAHYIVQADL